MGIAVERDLQRIRLDAVIELRGSAMQIRIVHITRGDSGFFHGESDGTSGFFATFFEAYAVERFTG